MTTRAIDTDVLVVGAGPTGLTAALSLADQGVNAITISRYPGPSPTPRAHITNKRTMEVFRDLGVESRIREVGHPLSWLHNNLFVTTMAGLEIARYKSYGASEDRMSDYAAASPSEAINCPQHVMEPVLLAAARERGADVRYSNELVTVEQTAEGTMARVRERETGDEYLVRARYVIAADGARSTIAEQLGFQFEGQAGLKGMATCWLVADLTKYVAHRPGVLYWIAVPGRLDESFGTASLNNMRPWNGWTFVFPWDADGLPSEEEVLDLAHRCVGDPEIDIQVKAITKWQINNVVATNYRNGRVFLAGDAAHRHPPYGGLGTNTSIQDAYNLGWKLACVLNGSASESLLDSYSAERQPVGAQVVQRAIASWHNMASLIEALGLREGQTEAETWAALREIYENSPQGSHRRELLAKALRQQTYRSNALGVELGQRYESGAVIGDGTPPPVPERDPELYYEPTTRPGAHLPHAWVEHERELVSTLDLVGHSKFSLIVGVGGQPWARAAAEVGAELGIDLPVFTIGLRCDYDDVVGAWESLRGIGDGGAILVRPDRHVAWRSADMASSPAEALRAVLSQVLSIESS